MLCGPAPAESEVNSLMRLAIFCICVSAVSEDSERDLAIEAAD